MGRRRSHWRGGYGRNDSMDVAFGEGGDPVGSDVSEGEMFETLFSGPAMDGGSGGTSAAVGEPPAESNKRRREAMVQMLFGDEGDSEEAGALANSGGQEPASNSSSGSQALIANPSLKRARMA